MLPGALVVVDAPPPVARPHYHLEQRLGRGQPAIQRQVRCQQALRARGRQFQGERRALVRSIGAQDHGILLGTGEKNSDVGGEVAGAGNVLVDPGVQGGLAIGRRGGPWQRPVPCVRLAQGGNGEGARQLLAAGLGSGAQLQEHVQKGLKLRAAEVPAAAPARVRCHHRRRPARLRRGRRPLAHRKVLVIAHPHARQPPQRLKHQRVGAQVKREEVNVVHVRRAHVGEHGGLVHCAVQGKGASVLLPGAEAHHLYHIVLKGIGSIQRKADTVEGEDGPQGHARGHAIGGFRQVCHCPVQVARAGSEADGLVRAPGAALAVHVAELRNGAASAGEQAPARGAAGQAGGSNSGGRCGRRSACSGRVNLLGVAQQEQGGGGEGRGSAALRARRSRGRGAALRHVESHGGAATGPIFSFHPVALHWAPPQRPLALLHTRSGVGWVLHIHKYLTITRMRLSVICAAALGLLALARSQVRGESFPQVSTPHVFALLLLRVSLAACPFAAAPGSYCTGSVETLCPTGAYCAGGGAANASCMVRANCATTGLAAEPLPRITMCTAFGKSSINTSFTLASGASVVVMTNPPDTYYGAKWDCSLTLAVLNGTLQLSLLTVNTQRDRDFLAVYDSFSSPPLTTANPFFLIRFSGSSSRLRARNLSTYDTFSSGTTMTLAFTSDEVYQLPFGAAVLIKSLPSPVSKSYTCCGDGGWTIGFPYSNSTPDFKLFNIEADNRTCPQFSTLVNASNQLYCSACPSGYFCPRGTGYSSTMKSCDTKALTINPCLGWTCDIGYTGDRCWDCLRTYGSVFYHDTTFGGSAGCTQCSSRVVILFIFSVLFFFLVVCSSGLFWFCCRPACCQKLANFYANAKALKDDPRLLEEKPTMDLIWTMVRSHWTRILTMAPYLSANSAVMVQATFPFAFGPYTECFFWSLTYYNRYWLTVGGAATALLLAKSYDSLFKHETTDTILRFALPVVISYSLRAVTCVKVDNVWVLYGDASTLCNSDAGAPFYVAVTLLILNFVYVMHHTFTAPNSSLHEVKDLGQLASQCAFVTVGVNVADFLRQYVTPLNVISPLAVKAIYFILSLSFWGLSYYAFVKIPKDRGLAASPPGQLDLNRAFFSVFCIGFFCDILLVLVQSGALQTTAPSAMGDDDSYAESYGRGADVESTIQLALFAACFLGPFGLLAIMMREVLKQSGLATRVEESEFYLFAQSARATAGRRPGPPPFFFNPTHSSIFILAFYQ